MTTAAAVIAHAWRGRAFFAAALPDLRPDLVVLAVRTPPGGLRETVREEVRDAATQALSIWCGCPASDVALDSTPGQPITALVTGRAVGISLAHEPGVDAASPGLSLVALHRGGPVGVDVLRNDEQFDSAAVADLYLSPAARVRIAAQAPALRHAAFADEWARMEAGHKCQGLGLSEWTPQLDSGLQSCTYVALQGLPPPFVGAVAIARP